eukprot:6190474-Pleurochrysis_carterae.AAC.3
MEAYLKYKLNLGIEGVQTKKAIHEALSRKKWGSAPRTPDCGKRMNLSRGREKLRQDLLPSIEP